MAQGGALTLGGAYISNYAVALSIIHCVRHVMKAQQKLHAFSPLWNCFNEQTTLYLEVPDGGGLPCSRQGAVHPGHYLSISNRPIRFG